MTRSFHVRLALLSAFLSGLVLLAFAAYFLHVLHGAGLDRIDRELQALVESTMRKAQPPGHWARFDASLAGLHGTRRTGVFAVKVNTADGNPLYRSAGWPEDLAASTLGIPEIAGREPPERPPPRDDRREPGGGPPRELRIATPRFLTLATGGREWRIGVLANEEIVLALAMDLADFHGDVRRVLKTFAVAAPVALLLLTLAGWWIARHALRPVKVLTRIAGGITAKGLDRRVPSTSADREFRALVDVINGMLDRLERSFGQATRFSADAAHELRTPLTILQGELEGFLQAAPAGSDEQRRYGGLLDEVQRLKSIVQKLLLLARADAGRLAPECVPVDLSGQLAALCEDATILGPGLAINRRIAPGITVKADPALLMQAFRNLVDNAVKYNTEGGRVDIALETAAGRAVASVRNTVRTGAALDSGRLFDRFYRGDPAHGRRADGAGLGLSISREIARAHGGDLEFCGIQNGVAVFQLVLPLP